MKLQRQQHEDPDITLTPLIDVVFLLLIFFMVSTTFKHEGELKVDLPKATAEPVQRETEPLELIIDAQGRYRIGEREIVKPDVKALKQALETAAGGNTDQPLVIRADGKAPHEAVVRAMDAAGKAGLTSMSIATVRSDE